MKTGKSIIAIALVMISMAAMSFKTQVQEEEEKPQATINNVEGDELTHDYLASVERLLIKVSGEINVLSYEILVAPKGGTATVTVMNGNRVPRSIHDKLMNATEETQVVVQKVIGVKRDGTEITCEHVVYTIPKVEEEE